MRAKDILRVDTAAILLLDEDAQELVARAAKGLEEEVERGVRIPVGGGFAGRIAAGPQADLHRRRRPRRHPEPDPAHEGRALAARRAAARGGRHPRRAARRARSRRASSPTPTPRCCSSRRRRRRPRSTARACSTRSTASIAARSRCSAACCPTACPTSSASTPRRATCRRATRSAATGTTSSSCRAARSASPSGTSPAMGCGPRRSWASCARACAPTRWRATRPARRSSAWTACCRRSRAAGWPPPPTRSSIPRRARCATPARATRRRCSSAVAGRPRLLGIDAAPPLGSLAFAYLPRGRDDARARRHDPALHRRPDRAPSRAADRRP